MNFYVTALIHCELYLKCYCPVMFDNLTFQTDKKKNKNKTNIQNFVLSCQKYNSKNS